MADDPLFGLHGQALALRSQRMALLASNIANAATPNYKARDFDFQKALATAGGTGDTHAAADKALGYRVPLQPSLDGNTVELSTEQTLFAENAVQYKTTLSFLQGRVGTVMSALKGSEDVTSPNLSIFDIAGRAMSAQLVRLSTTASNLANANTVSATKESAFRALKPVFQTVGGQSGAATVAVSRVVASDTPPTQRHEPENPLADKDGNVWEAGVDHAGELVEMMETARQYQNNVQVLQTAKSLTLDTLRIEK